MRTRRCRDAGPQSIQPVFPMIETHGPTFYTMLGLTGLRRFGPTPPAFRTG
jgi:hypothetical protein